jgi:hypothetical protein
MSTDLYDLEPRYAALADLPLESEDGADEDAALCEALDAIRDEARDKALSLAKVCQCLEAEVRLLEEHTRLLQSKTQTRRDRVDYLRRRIQVELETAGIDKVKDPFVTAWLQQSPPSVEVIDELAVPSEFMRAVLRLPLSLVPEDLRGLVRHLEIDRAGILEFAKRTGELPAGVAMKKAERHLRIR